MELDDKILTLFRKHKDAFLSGEEISGELGISRQALWKHIEKLRTIGYAIEAVPHLGYKLLHIPDKLLSSEIKWNLKTRIIGRQILSYEKVDSTNDIAYELAARGAKEGSVIVADEQTKGKGRLGRSWVSPPRSGVYLSCILRPNISPSEVSKITLVAAVSVVRSIRRYSGLEALIRWPNDILVSGKKISGILTELKAEMDRVDFVVIGIGVNVNTPKKSLPREATSIREEKQKDFSRLEFTHLLLNMLEEEYIKFREVGFSPIREELKRYSCTLGRYINITTTGNKRFSGEAVDIDNLGALIVRLDSGLQQAFLSGDVTLVR